MSIQLSPGVLTKETDLSQIVTAIGTSIGAVVGISKRGPVKWRQLITNIKEFVEVFGEPDASLSFMHYSALAFLSVARQLYVTRVVGSGATHAGIESTSVSAGSQALNGSISPTAPNTNPTYTFGTNGIMAFFAIGPGAYANTELSIKVTNLDTTVTPNTFDVEVYYTPPGGNKSKVEVFERCARSKSIDGFGVQQYVENRINGVSKYIRVYNNTANTTNPFVMSADVALAGGVDGSAPSSANIEGTDGWELYSNPDEVNVNILMCGGIGVASTQLVIDGIASSRKDAVAILVVPTASQTGSGEVIFRSTTLNLNSSYSALYTPDLKIRDQFNNSVLFVPPDGYVGACYALTDIVRDPWYAPAGLNRGLLRVLDVYIRYTEGQRDSLYVKQINPIRNIPGQGVAIWGQKTLQVKESALSRVNVRRLLIVVEKSIAAALVYIVFELNNQFTRLQVFQMVDSFMRRIKARNGVYDYKVVCDETNNDQTVIDNNELNVDVYIKPQRAAEFIRLQAVITRTGANFNELIATGGNF